MIEPLLAGLEKGSYEPVVAEAFPFDRAADAHRYIARAPQRRQGRPGSVIDPIVADLGEAYQRRQPRRAGDRRHGREPEFLFFVAFLLTFGFIRTSAHMIRAQVSWWPGNVEVGGTHVHHLVWGILMLLDRRLHRVAIARPSPWREILAVLFGIGTGLTLDEFALWLNLKDVYWSKQGRRSIDAVIVAATFTGMVLVGFTAWVDVATAVEAAVFAFVGAFGVLTILVGRSTPPRRSSEWR